MIKIFLGVFILFLFPPAGNVLVFAGQPASDSNGQSLTPTETAQQTKAHEYYEKGMKLINEGKPDEASQYFEKAIQLAQTLQQPNIKQPSRQQAAVSPKAATVPVLTKPEEGQKTQQQQQQQQQQAEKRRRQQEALRQQEFEAKRRQQMEALQQQYVQAIRLYKKKEMDKALGAFKEIENSYPDFKRTTGYIERIERWQAERKELAERRQMALELKARNDQASKIYDMALRSYRARQWQAAGAQFESVAQIIPDYKHTQWYLKKIGIFMAREAARPSSPSPVEGSPKPAAAPVKPKLTSAPAPVVPVVKTAVDSLEDQQKQARDIAALAQESSMLYHQIADIADDKSTIQTKAKMAQVDEILNGLKANKERLYQEDLASEVEKFYQQGRDYLGSHDYANAKIKFMEVEHIWPDYRDTRRNLGRIDEALKKQSVEAITGRERARAEQFEKMQYQEIAAQLRRDELEQENELRLARQQQDSLKELARKASDINDDIIRLSRAQDYEGMKRKFVQLQGTIDALTQLKAQMAMQQGKIERAKQLSRDAIRRRDELMREAKQENGQISGSTKSSYHQKELSGFLLSNRPTRADIYKRREIMREQNALFDEAVECYARRQYAQAKLLFGELASQHDRRSEAWLKKVDRAITRELLKGQEAQVRERTAFLEDQLKAQRQLAVVQERERRHQKKLTEELERQKRAYEDNRLMQWRKQEMLEAQVLERRRQEEKHAQWEKEKAKEEREFRFRRITNAAKPAAISSKAGAQARSALSKAKLAAVSHAATVEVKPKPVAAKLKPVAAKPKLVAAKPKPAAVKSKPVVVHAASLEVRREELRKQLQHGVESLYQGALSLYRAGDYAQAANRFKDVDEIFPGYKNTREYMDKARRKSSAVNSEAPANPHVSGNSTSNNRQGYISRALDLFDTNAQ
ncbi:MAG: hypothetical protein KGI24_06050 [Candidatus Omnitrophica bacterium]|nr:hypothetical protein [Candidatus Omnitrophota bacterium]